MILDIKQENLKIKIDALEMKFIINNFTYTSMRALNILQLPEVGEMYTCDVNGVVWGKNARVKYEDKWIWIPSENLTGSYYFTVIPIDIDITIISE